jgi:hypothetical protein
MLCATGTKWRLGVWKGEEPHGLLKTHDGFSDTLQRVREALQAEGFGVITDQPETNAFPAQSWQRLTRYAAALNKAAAATAIQIR